MKKYFYLLLFSSGIFSGAKIFAQQDPQFSQYMFNPLSVNPAYAGSRGMLNGAIVYRNQWTGFDGAPVTQVLAINAPSRKGKVGLGIEFVNDKLGPKNTTGAYLDYAYRVHLGKGKLAFGLGAGLLDYKVNWAKVEYKDQSDPYAGIGTTNITHPDFKFGMYFNNKNFYCGLSFTHINREAYTVVKDSLTFSSVTSLHKFFTIGRAFRINDNLLFSPSLVIRSVGGIHEGSADINLNFRFKEIFWAGLSVRTEQSLVFIFQYNITNHIKLGYSYDMTMSKLRTYQSGTHEIVLGFDLNLFQSQVMSPRFF
ncbi:MAG: type IX secretion system membrane protein PorP/SprF [Bacteroidetes bacterium]|nr:type IX secretion system membrane protein PorP/SprF [Bacteroidota bacterium]